MEKKQQILLDLVRQRFASIVWTHKIHEKQADIIYRKYQIIMTANIVMTAFTTCGILALFKTNDCIVKSLTCLLSFITTLTSAYIKHFDSLIDYKTYKKSANEFLVIRNRLEKLIAEFYNPETNYETLKDKFDEIDLKLEELFLKAPITDNNAIKMANKGLKINKEYTFTNEEIDEFLPKSLSTKDFNNKNMEGNNDPN